MARGNALQARVHYQGKDEDFIVMIDDKESAQKWKEDKTIPLAQVVSSFKVFITHKQGDQGILDTASNATLENEFGTHKDEDVVMEILQKGTIKESDAQERSGSTNDSKGGRVAH
ncbi:MAG: hypothetical protein GOMPHAMPRED_002014 [Gomphillus americanus]|uniref:Ribosome maturation protein SDO1/SBDS N-terminal domain-containing protein n=1 Tax=Gomphillus americanus TaxID=1940652 RepID=A0A8H3FAU7_9LECA|nr:MAG: hypothetical protein GOMPHAMPRED_002014 [Gomphillus americanus]